MNFSLSTLCILSILLHVTIIKPAEVPNLEGTWQLISGTLMKKEIVYLRIYTSKNKND